MDFFDRSGAPVCYAPDRRTFFFWTGEPAGFLRGGAVNAYDGRFLGWFDRGWLYDRENRPALFTGQAMGGPLRPLRLARAEKAPRQAVPMTAAPRPTPPQPVRQRGWSPHSGNAYFSQGA